MAAAVVLLVAGACGGDDGEGAKTVALDGTPRIPDAEGVVTDVSRDRLVLDDGRELAIGDTLQSFSTYDGTTSPVLGRRGQYVQVGVDGDTLVWVAGIGVVVDGSPDAVYYSGRLVDVDGVRLVFRDGTVLTAAKGLDGVDGLIGSDVQAVIDPASHVVRELSPA